MFPIAAAIGAAQLIAGLATNASKKDPNLPVMRVTPATAEAVARARMRANADYSPERLQMQKDIRQQTADTVGMAKQTTDDPSKLGAALERANLQGLRQYGRLGIMDIQNRRQAEGNLQGALGRLGGEQSNIQRENIANYRERQTSKRNLIGAGLNNIVEYANQQEVLKTMKEVYGAGGAGGASKDPSALNMLLSGLLKKKTASKYTPMQYMVGETPTD